MTINYEILDELKTKNFLTTSFIFEQIDFRKREAAYKVCLEKVSSFLLNKFSYVSLILFNIKITDSKVNRHFGVWNILEKKYKITFPSGRGSVFLEEKNENLNYICKIDIDSKDVLKNVEILDKHRSSMLLLGNAKIDDVLLDVFLKSIEHLNSSDTVSWLPLATEVTKRDLIGVRLFGMFDDLENGVVVYEPIIFSKLHGDWSLRGT